ncbi:MAG: hypothetical protein M3332_03005 [Actinomycetota bacterium]|nr:hypothetical protein [Actinomycetota bacterium]
MTFAVLLPLAVELAQTVLQGHYCTISDVLTDGHWRAARVALPIGCGCDGLDRFAMDFYLRLTEGRQGDNHLLPTVSPMATTALHLRQDLSVRPGESDPAGMLCRVLMLLVAIVSMAALALLWWLA